MEINQIDWGKLKERIGRWVISEGHAGQVKYCLESDFDNPFVITEFTVNFENETVSTGWRGEFSGYQEEVPLTPEERAEAEKMIFDCRLIDLTFNIRPDSDVDCEIKPLKDIYDVDLKRDKHLNVAYVHGNHNNIASAICDGYICSWALEDPEVEHDKACGLSLELCGNWDI